MIVYENVKTRSFIVVGEAHEQSSEARSELSIYIGSSESCSGNTPVSYSMSYLQASVGTGLSACLHLP